MNKVCAGAMTLVMALCFLGITLPLGGVNAEVAAPAYGFTALLAVLWVGWVAWGKEPAWNRSPIHLPVGLFLVYAVIRYFSSPFEYEARGELLQLIACGLIYLCATSYFHRPRDRTAFLVILLVLALFQSGYGVWQTFTKSQTTFIWERPPAYLGRASGTFIYPNQLASFLGLVLGLVLGRLLLVPREGRTVERSVLAKVILTYATVMIISAIVATKSRAGWLAVGIGLCLMLFLGRWRGWLNWRRAGFVAGAAMIIGFVAFRSDLVQNHLVRTFEVDPARKALAIGDRTLGGRTLMWRETVRMIREHPVFGTGIGSWQWLFQQRKPKELLTRPEYPHNDYLNLASDYGVVGFLLLAWAFVAFFRQAWKVSQPGPAPEKHAFACGAMVAVSMLLVHCWFDFNLHLPANSLLLAAIFGMVGALEASPTRYARCPFPGFSRFLVAGGTLAVCTIWLWRFLPTATAFRYTDLGNQLRKDLQYDAALTYFEAAVALDPTFAEPRVRLGDVNRTLALWRLGPEKRAERQAFALKAAEAYDGALALNPYQSFVLVDRGRVLDMAGRDAEAIKTFERSIEVYPGNAFAYFVFGCYYRDHGDPERAKQLFQKSEDINYVLSAGLNSYELRGNK